MFAVLGDRGNFGGMAQLQELRNALLDFRVRLKTGFCRGFGCLTSRLTSLQEREGGVAHTT